VNFGGDRLEDIEAGGRGGLILIALRDDFSLMG
jgi:hypothetical protein